MYLRSVSFMFMFSVGEFPAVTVSVIISSVPSAFTPTRYGFASLNLCLSCACVRSVPWFSPAPVSNLAVLKYRRSSRLLSSITVMKSWTPPNAGFPSSFLVCPLLWFTNSVR